MTLNLPIFTGMTLEEDTQGFIGELEKIFEFIHANEVEGLN